MNVSKERKKAGSRLFLKNAVLVAVVVFAVLLMGFSAGVARWVQSDRFVQGISINGTDVSGMSYEEGQAAVYEKLNDELAGIELPVVFEGASAVFTADDLGIRTNAKTIMENAFFYNKQQEDAISKRFDKSTEIIGRDFSIDVVVDEKKLKESLVKFSEKSTVPAVDAQAVFNKERRSFTYSKEKDGETLDIEAAIQGVTERIQQADYTEYILTGEMVSPEITLDDLKKNTVPIGFCETEATSDENRNTNIDLMCQAIDGQVLAPGEVLSINGLVGERTEEKGFKKAPAIIDGTKLSDEFGGGICQVSGTLYNAALAADMEIVERVHHTWPSSYLPVGLDSTLNWDDKDLKIKNKSAYPLYISAVFKDRKVQVEIFGQPLPDGMTIEIKNDILKKIDPPPPDIIYTNELPVGMRRTRVSAREGYDVEVSRNYVMDGLIVKKEVISKDYYPVIKGIILEGVATQEK